MHYAILLRNCPRSNPSAALPIRRSDPRKPGQHRGRDLALDQSHRHGAKMMAIERLPTIRVIALEPYGALGHNLAGAGVWSAGDDLVALGRDDALDGQLFRIVRRAEDDDVAPPDAWPLSVDHLHQHEGAGEEGAGGAGGG
jgi:hypothetical protein